MKRELLVGCGSRRDKKIKAGTEDWTNLTTLDIVAAHRPDVVADLDDGLPFADDAFDEVHAYEVLEHLGRQGDADSFFFHFGEVWRVLKPDGILAATVPAKNSPWVWGDPSHTRYIGPESLTFLSQQAYRDQVGVTPMTDFRHIWRGDFEPVWFQDDESPTFAFVLRAIKKRR